MTFFIKERMEHAKLGLYANGRRLLPALLAAFLASSADAKVTFTGYGDLRDSAGVNTKISGSAPTLAAFGTNAGNKTSSGFSANAVGLFATTEVHENLQFKMDLTFQKIGNQVGQTIIQYAYLDWTPTPDTTGRAGRVTLPFGYFNENRFYAFQRYGITPPIFQTGFLGLPIADWGVVGQQRFHLQPFTVEATAYVVNGYGSSPGTTNTLRRPSTPGGITLINNLGAADNNHKPAVGGRVSLKDIGGANVETGVSYYWADWDTSGLEPMYMIDTHLHVYQSGFDLLVESLHIGVRGDQGFGAVIGDPNWSTDGGFATLSYDGFKVKDKMLAPYVQGEIYRSRPNNGGRERETLRTETVGAAYKVLSNLTVKAEYLHLSYDLPDVATGGPLRLTGGGPILSLVVTF
jgi:hypothetical protein